MTVADVLGDGLGVQVYEQLAGHLGDRARLRVARTQVGWARRRGFAYLWSARRWQGGRAAPVVLTLALTSAQPSARFKHVNEVRPGLWNHHLEIHDVSQIDEEVLQWLDAAWASAG